MLLLQYRLVIHQSCNFRTWLWEQYGSLPLYHCCTSTPPRLWLAWSLSMVSFWIRSANLISSSLPFKCLSFPSSDVLFSSSDDLPTGIFSFSQTILMFSCITHGSLSISSEIFPLQVFSRVGPCFTLFSVDFSISSHSTFVSRHCNLFSIFILSAFTFSVPALKETKEFQIITKDSMVISCLLKN